MSEFPLRSVLFDIAKIVDGAHNADAEKVLVYGRALAAKLKECGETEAAERVLGIIGDRPSRVLRVCKLAPDHLTADTEASTPIAVKPPSYTIAPLEFQLLKRNWNGCLTWQAETVFGDVYVGELIINGKIGVKWWLGGVQGGTDCTSIDDGKAAAEAWYRARLLSALKPVEE